MSSEGAVIGTFMAVGIIMLFLWMAS